MIKRNINMHKKIILRLILAVFFFTLYFHASSALASTINLSPSAGSYNVGDTIRVRVAVSSTVSINAVSGTISYPASLLSLTSISKAGSLVSLWAQEPSYSNASGTASFEGVILNGYTGANGTVITLIFKAKSEGTASLNFTRASILANDGNGTETVSGKGISSLSISKAIAKKEEPKPVVIVKNTTIKIEEIKSPTDGLVKKFLVSPPEPVTDNAYTVSIDSLNNVSWIDDGKHIFQAPELSSGIHTVRMSAKTKGGSNLTGFIEFSTIAVMTPVITDYPVDLKADQFLVLKGVADPLVGIQITITDMETNDATIGHADANDKGRWSFVSDEKMAIGTYSIMAKAITEEGIESSTSNPLTIEVTGKIFNKFMSKMHSFLSILTPVIALILLLVLIIIYGMYYINRVRIYLKKKILKTEKIIEKNFNILEEDISEEAAIFRKIKAGRPLSPSEKIFAHKFKKDIEAAEEVITKEVKDIEK
jgi:hypothetical protein